MKKISTAPTVPELVQEVNDILAGESNFEFGNDKTGQPKHKWNQNLEFLYQLFEGYCMRLDMQEANNIASHIESISRLN